MSTTNGSGGPPFDTRYISALFVICIFLTGFAPLFEGGTTHLPVLAMKLMVLALAGAAVYGGIAASKAVIPKTPLDTAVLLFAIATAISLTVAPYKNMALTWVQLILYYTVFYYLSGLALSGKGYAGRAAVFILLMGVMESAVALYQRSAGMLRATGTFFNPNMLAGYLAVTVLMAVSLLLFDNGHVRRRHGKYVLAGVVLLCLTVIVLTGSRGGVLCFSAGLFVVLWHRYRMLAAAAAAALVIAVLVVPNPVRERALHGDPLAYSRTQIWASAIEMIKDHPAGAGLGNFKYFSERYKFPVDELARYGKVANTAHNEYLHFGAEMGVAGMLAMAFAMFMLVKTMSVSVSSASRDDRALAIGASGGVYSILAQSAVDSNMHEPGIVFMLILLVSMVAAVSGQGGARYRVFDIPAASRVRFGVLTGLLLVLLACWAVIPEAARQYSERGVRLLKSGQPEEALKCEDVATTLDAGNATYHEQRASALYAIYVKVGEEAVFMEAVEELKEAERLNPNAPSYPSLLASIGSRYAAGLSDPVKKRAVLEKSLEDISRAVDVGPYDVGLLYRQAMTLVSLDRTGEAVGVLERARDLEPNYLRVRLELAKIYFRTGSKELAIRECYSILKTHERLLATGPGHNRDAFISVDMEEVKRLLSIAGGGKV